MLKKVILLGIPVLYTLFYIFSYFWGGSYIENSLQELPGVASSYNRFEQDETLTKTIPSASKAKVIDKGSLSIEAVRKTKKTPFSLPDDYVLTFGDRISKEEVLASPVVYVIPKTSNGVSYELIVVEKNGKLYDASDGVRVFLPRL